MLDACSDRTLEDAVPTAADSVCASCLGALGRFGNGVFQLLACALLAERAGLVLAIPDSWAHAAVFEGASGWHHLPAADAYRLPLVADRVVISHPGFKAWALQHPTGKALAARLLGGSATASPKADQQDLTAPPGRRPAPVGLSGRQLRHNFPQVCAEDLAVSADATELRQKLQGAQLFGWFQVRIPRPAPTFVHRRSSRGVAHY